MRNDFIQDLLPSDQELLVGGLSSRGDSAITGVARLAGNRPTEVKVFLNAQITRIDKLVDSRIPENIQ